VIHGPAAKTTSTSAATVTQGSKPMQKRPPIERAAFTVNEFCEAHRISRAKLYCMWGDGTGPRRMKIGTKTLISVEAAADWRRERAAASGDGCPASHAA
jgi:predicted DNA-binding transcriptional regulator AlpA